MLHPPLMVAHPPAPANDVVRKQVTKLLDRTIASVLADAGFHGKVGIEATINNGQVQFIRVIQEQTHKP